MLELAKYSWEGVVLGGSWVCHVVCIKLTTIIEGDECLFHLVQQ